MIQGKFAIFASVSAAAMLLLSAVSGCGGGDDDNQDSGSQNGGTATARAQLIGTWRTTSLTTDRSSIACPGTIHDNNGANFSCSDNDVTVFRADGSFRSLTYDGRFRETVGTWILDGANFKSVATRQSYDRNNNGLFETGEAIPIAPIVGVSEGTISLSQDSLVVTTRVNTALRVANYRRQ